MKRFIVATKNEGKLKEIRKVLEGMPFEVISMVQAGINDDIEENGKTFEENSYIKASYIARITGEIVMADDSGLEVDCIDGAPGIYSARFNGIGAKDIDNNNKLLTMMSNVPMEERSARFVSAICVVLPDGNNFTVRGTCEGYIGFDPKGDKGFGYDPLFYLPEFKKTMAEMNLDEKNKVSHRGKALKLMIEELKKWF